MRTPDIVESLQRMNSGMILEMAKRIYSDVDRVAADLRKDLTRAGKSDEEVRAEAQAMRDMAHNGGFTVETNERWAVGMAIKMAFNLAPIFARRDWVIAHRDNEKKSFVTTDAPVVLTSTEPRGQGVYGVGFGSTDALISFPLTQSSVLTMHGTDGGFHHINVNADKVQSANLAMAERCKRFVGGRDDALVQSLAKRVGLARSRWRPKNAGRLAAVHRLRCELRLATRNRARGGSDRVRPTRSADSTARLTRHPLFPLSHAPVQRAGRSRTQTRL